MTDLRRRIDELIRKWSLLIEETIETASSVLAFGVRGDQPIVLNYNVLSDAQRGWLAIDPKGVVGEIEYEVGALFRNPIEAPDLFTSAATIHKRLDCLSRELNLDSGRVLRWTFAQAVLAAIWEVEDGHPVDAANSRIRLAQTVRAMLR